MPSAKTPRVRDDGNAVANLLTDWNGIERRARKHRCAVELQLALMRELLESSGEIAAEDAVEDTGRLEKLQSR